MKWIKQLSMIRSQINKLNKNKVNKQTIMKYFIKNLLLVATTQFISKRPSSKTIAFPVTNLKK